MDLVPNTQKIPVGLLTGGQFGVTAQTDAESQGPDREGETAVLLLLIVTGVDGFPSRHQTRDAQAMRVLVSFQQWHFMPGLAALIAQKG